ncbi:MAG: sigma-54-dependent Fis family transcriptional regulator [Bryobacterales bacterium]|nr:sigma-54-dependent Fis family transcriptional regulator [Bryobacterales bacterium]MBV9400458.1 sigma-54-dependent Fis family transcriptional regulator [Bryobacterales bacterium]
MHAAEARHVLVGQSPGIRHIWDLIEKIGDGRWPALLLGETGTGKEVVAREIHARNPQGLFVTIDCSSMVGPLMESELFGHVKGAFTGAAGSKIGLIEAANGGTAFFDEIGELPLDLQAKLLRVLQEKEFRPVGSLSVRRSDFRIIAATNRDLASEVEKGTFRRDLFFRLNVTKIRLAPLRERKEDIPALVEHFFARAGAGKSLTPEVMDALLSYDWPGNVRELENCVQHMIALSSEFLVHTVDLPSSIQNHVAQKKSQSLFAVAGAQHTGFPARVPQPPASKPEAVSSSAIIPLAEVEKRAILHALEVTGGDRALAAALLGIGRTTLYRKLKEYQVAG